MDLNFDGYCRENFFCLKTDSEICIDSETKNCFYIMDEFTCKDIEHEYCIYLFNEKQFCNE
jgi:hypothetical protein